ncbi:MAG: mechanosensitive ion channel [Phycisphaerales bacterium]
MRIGAFTCSWFSLVLLLAASALAQQQSSEQPAAEPSAAIGDGLAPIEPPPPARVQERIAQVEADESLEAPVREALLAPLRAAAAALEARDQALAERQQLLDAAASAPGRLEQLRAELDQPVALPEFDDFGQRPADEALEAIRALLAEAEARLAAAEAEQDRLRTEAATREVRLAEGPAQLVALREDLTEAATALATLPEDPDDPVAQVRRWQQEAEAAALAARIARLEAELASYSARRDLLPLRRTLAQRKAATAAEIIGTLREAETEAANRVARQAQQQAERQAAQVDDPVLRALAEQTSELAERRLGPDGTRAALDSIRVAVERAKRELEEVQRRARNTAARVEAAGLTELVGRSLRDELRRLDRIDTAQVDRLSDRIDRTRLDLIDIEDQLAEYRDVQAAISQARQRMATGDEPVSPRVEQQITAIITNYVEMLRSLEREYRQFNDFAIILVATTSQLEESVEAFRSYIEERILWTRSVQGEAIPSLDDLSDGAMWLLGDSSSVSEAQGASAGSEDQANAWIRAIAGLWPPSFAAILAFIATVAAVWMRRGAKQAIKQSAAQVRKFSSDRFALTLKAIPVTLVLASALPLFLLALGLALEGTSAGVSRAIGIGLMHAAVLALGLETIRHFARVDGLADAHFRWRREALAHLRRVIFLLKLTLIPLAVVTYAFAEQDNQVLSDGLGRVGFVLAQLIVSSAAAWLFAPWLPLMRPYLSKRGGAMVSQLRWLWYPFTVLAPLSLGVLAGSGYYYTAAQLDQRLVLTVWLLVALLVAYNLVLRWLFIERRRLLVVRAQQKRDAQKGEQPSGGEVEGIEFESPAELDAAEVDAQTRRVLVAAILVALVVGLYSLWTEQLPALRMLDRVQLYPEVDFLDGETQEVSLPQAGDVADTGSPSSETGSQSSAADPLSLMTGGSAESSSPNEPIGSLTLADLGGALLIFALTWILARNLPGLLEITLLKRLPLDGGARFAVTSILRYLIAIVGIIAGFSAVGIGWSQVQFLAAALTFGLAFGLQEIFANFISGLIMLVERPVRVGDTVTVAGVDGRVTRIRMRATTVLDWELRELVIPNKVFITDSFINWTLSDPRVRILIPVGVAYGSDVRLVQRTLLEIGQTQEHVVAEPKVRSLFLGFGDNTLNFELRVYIEHFDYSLDTKNGLHMRIAERFKELGIEIAFPQRDIHIRDLGPLTSMLGQPAAQKLPPAEAKPAPGDG